MRDKIKRRKVKIERNMRDENLSPAPPPQKKNQAVIINPIHFCNKSHSNHFFAFWEISSQKHSKDPMKIARNETKKKK